jgi:hypothetical protein
MANAGYDPRAAQDLWEFMAAVEADNAAKGQTTVENRFALLRTHPTSEARHEALEGDMKNALALWKDHMAKYWQGVKAQQAKEKMEAEQREENKVNEVAVA